jgi:hypothetical protein
MSTDKCVRRYVFFSDFQGLCKHKILSSIHRYSHYLRLVVNGCVGIDERAEEGGLPRWRIAVYRNRE